MGKFERLFRVRLEKGGETGVDFAEFECRCFMDKSLVGLLDFGGKYENRKLCRSVVLNLIIMKYENSFKDKYHVMYQCCSYSFYQSII